MIHLDLHDDERDILVAVLENYLSDLRMEISNTDRLDFREMLRERKAVIVKVVEALKASKDAES